MKPRHILIVALVLGAIAVATPASAKRPDYKHYEGSAEYEDDHGRGRGRGSDDSYDHHRSGDHNRYEDRRGFELRFDDDRRQRARTYMRETYRPHCPPGLAKKHNGCLPPGQAKRYEIGGHLPHGHRPIPDTLLVRMGPPPHGTFYAMVDQDVLLVTEATKKILDAVTLLSAME